MDNGDYAQMINLVAAIFFYMRLFQNLEKKIELQLQWLISENVQRIKRNIASAPARIVEARTNRLYRQIQIITLYYTNLQRIISISFRFHFVSLKKNFVS